MSFSLPIVSTDVGAVKDAVISGKGGWFCDPEDKDSLMNILAQALAQKEQWSQMGLFNRKRYLEKFSSEAFVENWHEALAQLKKT